MTGFNFLFFSQSHISPFCRIFDLSIACTIGEDGALVGRFEPGLWDSDTEEDMIDTFPRNKQDRMAATALMASNDHPQTINQIGRRAARGETAGRLQAACVVASTSQRWLLAVGAPWAGPPPLPSETGRYVSSGLHPVDHHAVDLLAALGDGGHRDPVCPVPF